MIRVSQRAFKKAIYPLKLFGSFILNNTFRKRINYYFCEPIMFLGVWPPPGGGATLGIGIKILVNRGVAQLVARYVRDVEAGSSSLLTPTF